ncbi:SCP2 sterol-binding domain-containing protein [Tuberibacillus sp. Marseille-P3662]|uniref:SCP2 sterol-binding domain-containing protein n=1 Tax=Tuberibacillus sp. Marseille-P3662 TaxID=1965358 RepID=UPI000A1CD077|nr:SCP2 sterol-binding domain-containing protein [Tuberibacillus sp. Marseille-P3662]
MILREILDAFIHTLSLKPVLEPLYKDKPMTINIQSTHEQVWMRLNQEGGHVLESNPETADVFLSGQDKVIEAAMTGAEPMLSLQKNGHLNTQGSQNHLLALESLFLLTGHKSHLFHNH